MRLIGEWEPSRRGASDPQVYSVCAVRVVERLIPPRSIAVTSIHMHGNNYNNTAGSLSLMSSISGCRLKYTFSGLSVRGIPIYYSLLNGICGKSCIFIVNDSFAQPVGGGRFDHELHFALFIERREQISAFVNRIAECE